MKIFTNTYIHNVYICIQMYIFKHNMHIYTHICACIYMYMCVYIHVYMYLCEHRESG